MYQYGQQRTTKWAEHAACLREIKNMYKILVGKPERKRQLDQPRQKWEENITMDLTKIRSNGEDCVHLALDRDWWQALANTIINLQIP
jgi:hypothetical protein